ncbi:cadmium-translocating P-type ATPase [bacterium]|nr:cadmium-translocating P-type ATPase [bacterium]
MTQQLWIALLAVLGVCAHLIMRFAIPLPAYEQWPLWAALGLGGTPLIWDLLRKALRAEFGSDLLAGISIVTSILLQEYLAGAVVVLMLSGGEALESYAVGKASSVLAALAKRMPSRAHRKIPGGVEDLAVDRIQIDELLVIFPHEIAPVDGVVVDGRGRMDESYLTGEPYESSKVPGSEVLSGAINGDTSLVIRASKLAEDSRYSKIMRVMKDSEQHRPRMRRLGDQLGAIYTPIGVAIAALAWFVSGEPRRFLAVLVIATPCPLLIAIPVAIIGAISLAARRGIIIKDPTVLEQVGGCKTMILDKTGTLTYGRPHLTDVELQAGFDREDVLKWAASLERYSRHPLAAAVVEAADKAGLPNEEAAQIQELPGKGMQGEVCGRKVALASRKSLTPEQGAELPQARSGLEAMLLVDGQLAACFHFHDEPRSDTRSFLQHLQERHGFRKLMIVSGDRREEVPYLADQVGRGAIAGVATEVHAGQSPEQKVDIVRQETARTTTVYLGDGINDAPALTTATVGLAMGQNSDITTEAAGAVILDSSLRKVDEFLHIGKRMRHIALESAVGGMVLSVLGMLVAAAGWLTPVQGAIGQEIIDLLAVLNALRVGVPPASLTDYSQGPSA